MPLVPMPGLYRPEFEHDACGVAFIAHLHGRPSHAMVEMGLAGLCQLEHRGAKGADPATGDGAGLLVQVPDRFLRSRLDVGLPRAGPLYATGIAFLPPGAGEDDAAAPGSTRWPAGRLVGTGVAGCARGRRGCPGRRPGP